MHLRRNRRQPATHNKDSLALWLAEVGLEGRFYCEEQRNRNGQGVQGESDIDDNM